MDIKEMGQLEKEIIKSSSGSFPVMVLDTGGLIDIATALRQYNLIHRNGDRNPRYEKTTAFLRNLSQTIRVIITPRTYQEIQDHGKMRLNSHTIAFTPKVVDFALDTMADSIKFIAELNGQISLDDAGYDAYWAARDGCNGNHKKHLEGCSDTDKEILATAAYLSRSRVNGTIDREIEPVLVISPDAHIIKGSEFLKRGFGERYSSIVPISTRH